MRSLLHMCVSCFSLYLFLVGVIIIWGYYYLFICLFFFGGLVQAPARRVWAPGPRSFSRNGGAQEARYASQAGHHPPPLSKIQKNPRDGGEVM